MNGRLAFIATLCAGVLLGGAAVAGVDCSRGSGTATVPRAAATASATGADTGAIHSTAGASAVDFSALYEQVRPSIVEIDTSSTGRRRRQVQGQGSGIVLDASGDILTNDHVVDGATTVTVVFQDGKTASATVLGTDRTNDLATVKTDAPSDELHPATLGDSSSLRIGSVVAAVGNPFGLDGSLSTGVISGLDRNFDDGSGSVAQRGLLQTDAAINEGSSGGALFNVNGEVVGVTAALENPDATTFAGVGYAVPINIAKQELTQLEMR